MRGRGNRLLGFFRATEQRRPTETGSFAELIDALADFPKPLIMAVNGVGVGFGMTILGFADVAFMSSEARLRCPFSSIVLPHIGAGPQEMLVCGMSMGYADPAAQVNTFYTPRVPVAEFTRWLD